jgi:tripartite-type tricarboxylate transporter receptor subunit TctC
MKTIVAAVLAGALAFGAGAAAETKYPERAVKIEVGYAAGGPLDVVARLLGDKLSQVWGKPVVIENVSGASGNIAAERVAKAAPDGYTLMLASNVNIAVNPKLYKSMAFDPLKDLVPITQVSYSPNILAIPNDLPVKSVQELVAYAKANPGKVSFASAGAGTTQHLAGELFKTIAKIDLQHVPYRGAAPAVTDLLGGRVSMFFGPPSSLLALVREGKLRGLAVTSAQRFPAVPELPTMIEAGYPGFVSVLSLGWMAPAGTPKDIVDKIYEDSAKVLALPEVRERLQKIGNEPMGTSPAEFVADIQREVPRWAEVIKAAGLTGTE